MILTTAYRDQTTVSRDLLALRTRPPGPRGLPRS